LSGGITFCALLPMRSIPFRVVCLLGLDDAAFPRKDHAPSFDLIAAHPALGDRSLRHEDRFLFLEALLSARDRLLVFYVGQGIRDGAERPPSVVVGELQDAIGNSFRLRKEAELPRQARLFGVDPPEQAETDVLQHLTVCHPLQPFSPRYFLAGGPLFSYAAAEARGARALSSPRQAALPLQTRLLPEPGPAPRRVALDELVRFLENPVRGLLQTELGLYLEENPILVEDREPFEPTPLERYELGRTLLERALEHGRIDSDPTLLRAGGALPLGSPGALYYQTLLPEVRAIVRAAQPFSDRPKLEALPFELRIAGSLLHGTLDSLWPAAQLFVRYSRVRAKTELGAWVRHLVLSCIRQAHHPDTTALVGRPLDDESELVRCERFKPAPLAQAEHWLAELVELYWTGRRSLLCLFPEPAKKYLMTLGAAREDAEAAALEAAIDVYRSRPFSSARAGSSDDYVRRAFGNVDPLAPEFLPFPGAAPGFEPLTRLVFEPLLAHLERVP
jgi:exodeoxyribonuclease V gamma subunit